MYPLFDRCCRPRSGPQQCAGHGWRSVHEVRVAAGAVALHDPPPARRHRSLALARRVAAPRVGRAVARTEAWPRPLPLAATPGSGARVLRGDLALVLPLGRQLRSHPGGLMDGSGRARLWRLPDVPRVPRGARRTLPAALGDGGSLARHGTDPRHAVSGRSEWVGAMAEHGTHVRTARVTA